jgi:molybdenum cofactor cytidylyltransferase
MGKIWSIILAAGESKRMGFPKMLLTFNGKTMIENVIDNIADSDSDNILVVLGANMDELIDLISKYDVKYCYNENYKEGMLSSVQCGFKNLPPDYGAAMVFQGDQPFISSAVINSIIAAYKSSNHGIVIPVYEGKRGHPLLLDCRYREQIGKLDPDEGLRSISHIFNDDIFEVTTDNPGILRDFDTYEDYKKEIKQN